MVHIRSTARHRIDWTPEESRIVRALALDWMHGRLATENVAISAAARALAQAGFEGRRTRRGIAYRIELEAEKLGRQRARARWSVGEDRTIDRYARAVAIGKYPDATAAAHACRAALSRQKRAFPRTLVAVVARISIKALEHGRPPARVVFTAEEEELLLKLARAVSRGRFRQVRDASRAFISESSRRRHGQAGRSPAAARSLDTLDRKLSQVARDAGLAWGFRDWSPEEDRVVDRFIRRYTDGRYRSLREAAKACRVALRRLDTSRLRRREHSRPYRRSLLAVQQHLNNRAIQADVVMPLFRRWRGVERQLAVQCARRILAEPVKGRPKRKGYALALQIKLRSLGYPRTLSACGAEIGRLMARGG